MLMGVCLSVESLAGLKRGKYISFSDEERVGSVSHVRINNCSDSLILFLILQIKSMNFAAE